MLNEDNRIPIAEMPFDLTRVDGVPGSRGRSERAPKSPNYALRRAVAAVAAVSLATIGASMVFQELRSRFGTIHCEDYTDMTVQPGMTATDAAQTVSGVDQLDVRDVVDDIAEHNPGVRIGSLSVGETIQVPARCVAAGE